MFQSTPARGGRPVRGPANLKEMLVSIHARTRRATQFRQVTLGDPVSIVSIHARTRRATGDS